MEPRHFAFWPPGLPIFGQLTPFPSTPLYQRLVKSDRLTRPKHWLDFAPFQMAHTPLKMSIPETQAELNQAWEASYSPERNARAIDSIGDKPIDHRIMHLISRLIFRGIYFPQMGKAAWARLFLANRGLIYKLAREGISRIRSSRLARPATVRPMQEIVGR